MARVLLEGLATGNPAGTAAAYPMGRRLGWGAVATPGSRPRVLIRRPAGGASAPEGQRVLLACDCGE